MSEEKVLSAGFLLKLVKGAAAEFSKDNLLRLSAALAYYSVFSLAPLLLIALGIAGKVLGPEAEEGKVAAQLATVMGPQAAQAVQEIVKSASKTGAGGTVIGFIFLFVGASTVFGQLKGALNTIWEVDLKPGLGIGAMVRQQF